MDSPSDNDNTPEPTHFLLKGWHEGEQGALHELIARDLDWVQNQVRLRVYGILGAKGEADDYVHDVMVKVLQYRPPSEMSDRDEFRALMKRIIENTLCNHAAALKRGKRDSRRERPIVSDSLLYLDPPQEEVTRPSVAVARGHQRDFIRMAIDSLPSDDSRIIRMRDWDGATFGDIAEAMGLSEDAVRMKYHRLLPKLAFMVEQLQAGRGLPPRSS